MIPFSEENDDKGCIINIFIKCTTVIIVQHKIAEHLPLIVQSQKNWNKINIGHSPSQY